MTVPTQSFTTMVSNAVTAIQGAATQLVDLTVGAVLRAFVDATCLLALWLQGIVLYVATLTRAATSNGTDLDSWMADWDFPRLGAEAASGQVTFARFTPSATATIPVGTIVQAASGTPQFTVIADTTQAAFNATLNAYVILPAVYSCTATVKAVAAGPGGNVSAGLLNTLGSAVPGVDTVTNAAAFSNGVNAELDVAYRARFALYLAGLARATQSAIENAIAGVQESIYYSITANYNYAGTYDLGYFYVIVDDGSGAAPSGLLSAVSNAIDAVRPICTGFGVFAATKVAANIAMALTALPGYSVSALEPIVQTAIEDYIDTLGVGATLPYTKLAQIAYDATPGIAEVIAGYTVNGGTADLTCTAQQVIRAGTVTIS